ncbi:hypothetical protein Tco_0616662 [Tanacetum coccineum]
MVSSLNNNKIDFRISFDESDDEDYTVIFDKNSFSYKIISVNDLKTDSENDNEKVNMPSFPSPEPKVSCFDDLDFFKDFENEFPAIAYNDALTSKLDFLTEPTVSPQHIDEFNLKDETSLSECDEEEQNMEGVGGNNVYDVLLAGKENGVNILKSIDEGPFQMGTFRETLAEGTEGALHLGPERPRVYSDLSPEDKERSNNADSGIKLPPQGVDRIEVRGTMPGCGRLQLVIGEHRIELGMLKQCSTDSNTFKDKMLLMQAQEMGWHLDERKLLVIDFSDDFDAFDSDVMRLPLQYYDVVCEHHEQHEMHDDVQQKYVLTRMSISSDSNMILVSYESKENKYLEEFLDMKALKEKVEDKLYKQDQSLQTVHMLCKPKPYYDELNKVAIGYKNPLCLTRAKQVQPALYNGHEIIKTNHVPAIVHNTEDTLEIAEITRKKMNDKMKDPECVTHKVKIAPPDYSKENYLATFTPQKQLTPEQIFWSQDLIKMKAEALKKQTTASRPIKALTVYPPNTPATLVPRVLPTKSQVKINIFALIQLFSEFDKTCKKRITPTGLTEGERGFEQTKELFYVAMNSELNVSRFTEMHDAHTIVKARCLELEVELSNLRDKIQKDNHNELVKRFSNLEVNHLNLQLKYQNLKESFGNNPPSPARDTPDFDSVFVIGKMKASLQGKDNVIKKLKTQISHLQETRSEADRTLDFRALDFQITQLTDKVTVLQEQNELFRAENEKIKQHYKELYDSIKITRAKHIEQTTALTTENENLKAQIQNKVKNVTKDHVKPTVLAPGKYAIDVEPIPPRNRNNREVHLDYLRHLKESVETLREIVEEAKVERPLDRSIVSACRYTKHSQELLEYAIGTCPKDYNQRDKKHDPTPLIRKKQVTFEEQCDTSHSNTHKHVEQLNIQKTNAFVPPSLQEVNSFVTD